MYKTKCINKNENNNFQYKIPRENLSNLEMFCKIFKAGNKLEMIVQSQKGNFTNDFNVFVGVLDLYFN
jgi:hypothetical protein